MADNRGPMADLSPAEKRQLLASLLQKKVDSPPAFQPLSQGQQALWFIHQMAPKSAAYNIACTVTLAPPLHVAALDRALAALVARHAALRTTYAVHGDGPMQFVHSGQKPFATAKGWDQKPFATAKEDQKPLATAMGWDPKPLLEEIDGSHGTAAEFEQRLAEEADRPFDLEHGPLFRALLFRRATGSGRPEEFVLLLAMHHIATDFWSLSILMHELEILYRAENRGAAGDPQASDRPLPPVKRQYTDYVQFQQEQLAGPAGERLAAYWKKQLAGVATQADLPFDRPRAPLQTYRGALHRLTLDAALAERLRALAKSEKTTLYTTFVAALQTLLARYTGQDDIVIGSPMLARNRAEFGEVVGYFSNAVALRANFAGDPQFTQLLAQARGTVTAAMEHQEYPFPLVVQGLQSPRDPSRSPLFQTMLAWEQLQRFENAASPAAAGESLDVKHVWVEQRGAPFDLTVQVFDAVGPLTITLQYNVDLFDASTIERLGGHFATLLAGIAADPQQRVSELPLLTAAERTQLIAWNATGVDYPRDLVLHDLFEAQAVRTPDAVAVVYDSQELTYRELQRRTDLLAKHLASLGVGPESIVAVFMERSLEMVIALYGILKAGGAYLPLNPEHPAERLARMLEDAAIPAILTQEHLAKKLPSSPASIVCLDTQWQALEANPSQAEVRKATPDNLAYVIYTSGSTGRPKGVMIPHVGIVNRILWMQDEYRLTPADRVLQKTPYDFDVSVWEFFWPLAIGATLVVARPGGHRDAAYLTRLIADERITTLHFVPSMLQVFLEQEGLESLTSVKRVMSSGEALSASLVDRFFDRFDAGLFNLYGPTEASVDVTHWPCRSESDHSSRRIIPIGHPIANTQIHILDPRLQPLPVGIAGELYIGGIGVGRGYRNQPELSAEKFIPDPFRGDAAAKLYKTGDLARRLPDGGIEYLGRLDHQVKIAGNRIELGEIESALERHPAVQATVVMAREDTPGDKRLVGYLAVQQEPAPSPAELRCFLKAALPDYMVPADFMVLDSLPRSANGKVDRKALPAPPRTRPEASGAYVPPRNPVETLLAQATAKVLGLAEVGIHDNFFDLGGTSHQSVQIVARVNQAGLQLSPEMLFQYQTVAELAAVCETTSH